MPQLRLSNMPRLLLQIVPNQPTMNAVFLPIEIWSMRLILANFTNLLPGQTYPECPQQLTFKRILNSL